MTEPLQEGAWGTGLAPVAGERVLDTYFPEVHLGLDGAPGGPGTRETGEPVATDERRGVRLVPVERVVGSLAEPPPALAPLDPPARGEPRRRLRRAQQRRRDEPRPGRPGRAPGRQDALPRGRR